MVALALSTALVAGVARADRELHVVGIYSGRTQTGTLSHDSRADVVVDRPGQSVTLVLTAYRATRWDVTLTRGTTLENVLLAGHGAARTRVFIDGVAFPGAPVLARYPFAYQPQGSGYRTLIESLPGIFGVAQVDSFQGAHTARLAGFRVDQVMRSDPSLQVDHLVDVVADIETVPVGLRPFLEAPAVPNWRVEYRDEVLSLFLTDEDTRRIPLSDKVPPPRWIGGSAYVAEEEAVYLVTYGGEGYLYRIDLASGEWRVVRSMAYRDVNGMLFDPARNRMLMTGGFPELEGVWLDDLQCAARLVAVNPADLAGYTDLYDPDNGATAQIFPIAVDGDMLLVAAYGGAPILSARPDAQRAERHWLIDLTDGSVTLVGYRNG